ncbi:hypothetical protein AA106_22165 [Photorhabdus laumondii subsp. laumondii]|uniref:Photorhabdus luminescens subsp. laumondii TTO1 complete genome segment 8/17 n=1 Tax=Photorhabdus laumondii subsp. laumondii (strain DSM 15139 / CIP 105565 / TT01) TaxID=243265 RepID=Q7N4Z9_PHOLL|nr:hypothetical protein A4R40_10835 [Photorhabdus laumondii subsp. laumondii]RAW68353.1 hypothetical protein CKY15_17250 [Photorhabdus sp. S7-51]RAW74980.1 hypothetical protein CKY06_18085 [Photorhabdus sp. S15-56]RAW89606.1 hypothetical protein CKY09_01640 [Photorhabdus sp. S5P8-50]RAW90072.1 hypothetical protein CKY12_01240 [Photorhabdus sp. S12-55]CAE14454.1 unnamed protein product [Photorhabdus laumondii subsp. laumondii TTO1]
MRRISDLYQGIRTEFVAVRMLQAETIPIGQNRYLFYIFADDDQEYIYQHSRFENHLDLLLQHGVNNFRIRQKLIK